MRMEAAQCLALFLNLIILLARVDGLSRVDLMERNLVPVASFPHKGQISSGSGQPPEFICDSCLHISREVEKILADPKLIERVGLFLSEVCHILPSDSEPKCLEGLDMYIHETVMFLQKIFQGENLCNSTGLCTEKSDQYLFRWARINRTNLRVQNIARNIEMLKLSDDKSCKSCHDTVDEILKALEDPAVKLKLIKALLKACEQVDNYVQQCKKIVFEYGPLVLAELGKYLKSNDVCSMVHICGGVGSQVM